MLKIDTKWSIYQNQDILEGGTNSVAGAHGYLSNGIIRLKSYMEGFVCPEGLLTDDGQTTDAWVIP